MAGAAEAQGAPLPRDPRMAYEESFRVSWAHLDGNSHMANTSFMAVAIDCRFHYFATRGVTPAEFAKWRIGPVVRRDEVDYFRELRLLEEARVTSLGGWLDLAARRLAAPPEPLAAALRDLERTADYAPLESSVRRA